MARTRPANPATVGDAIAQLQEMNEGARSELAAGRRRSAGTLAIAGAVRAVDLICDAAIGEHYVEPSHAVAFDTPRSPRPRANIGTTIEYPSRHVPVSGEDPPFMYL